MTPREKCLAHFRRRCAQRAIPADPAALAETILRMAPCWRRRPDRTGQERYRIRILLGGVRPALTVIWDDTLGVPVTAWWPWDDANTATAKEAA